MSVQQLRPPVFAGHVATARDAVAAAAAVPAGSLTRAELPDCLAEVASLEARVCALKHELLAEADARKLAADTGATGTDAWAGKLTGTNRDVMAGGIWLANQLRHKYHATRDAFADGGINKEQVRAIVRCAEQMPAQATPAQRTAAEEILVAKAVAGMRARGLRQAGRRMLETLSKELADQQESDSLHNEEDRAEQETWLSLHDNGDGTYTGRFVIPELHGHLLQAALERLTAPRRWSHNNTGQPVTDPTLPGMGGHFNITEQRGHAFCELLEHLPTQGHGGLATSLIITLPYQHLLDGLASARIDSGTHISPAQARRLACNSGIIPAVLGTKSQPLDLGRTSRLHTDTQRRALSLTHDTCAAEGCERPFAWCEIHHPDPWSHGGKTDLTNANPLCGWHHRRAHDHSYTSRRLPNGDIRFRRRQ
jgi:hypothetical protein